MSTNLSMPFYFLGVLLPSAAAAAVKQQLLIFLQSLFPFHADF